MEVPHTNTPWVRDSEMVTARLSVKRQKQQDSGCLEAAKVRRLHIQRRQGCKSKSNGVDDNPFIGGSYFVLTSLLWKQIKCLFSL